MPAQPSPSRMEAFSDGVIAVIITIMVLEFKVPKADGLAGFRTLLPTLAVYVLSFSFTGIYWINHHHLVDRLKRVDALILWANLSLLFSLSLLPFFTSYMIDKHLDSFSVALYICSLLFSGLTFGLLQKSIDRHLRRSGHPYEPAELLLQSGEQRKSLVSVAMYLLALPLAFFRPWLALLDAAFVTLLWILPTFGASEGPPAPPA